MKFGDWILKEQHGDQVGTEEPMEMLLKGKHKKIVKDALALDDPPCKFDEAFKTMTLEMIHDIDIEKNPEKKEWKDATLRDLTDSLNKWTAFEEARLGEFEEPEEEEEEPEEGEEEAPPEEEPEEEI